MTGPAANKTPWDDWWAQLLEIARRSGNAPGMPETWKQYNWARNQTPQEAYDAEYNMDNWR
ncbi:hypothetical protein LCH33_004099 [Pseudomonas amygdali]|uniref:Uncharacterized protein n=1 Tax=Pseudomonas amygdali pv. hibisci TaxID=251723 RepID=A0AB34U075_PSEA0|nr:hypothetical protein [Pseudomonas amygdali]KPX51192.1 Uncharacterized protein ALO67_01517 [Pseudomonas amygdali pv. hibisci]RMN61933.1 hypothetical protein ALQ57_00802 [Pseudomonas amygdali pv. hibisci]UBT80671.1 hypothetical protein LCH33_004099 [Pseudomonas amygdali]